MPKGYVFAVFIFLEIIEPRYWSLLMSRFLSCYLFASCWVPNATVFFGLFINQSVFLSVCLSISLSISLPSIGFLSREH